MMQKPRVTIFVKPGAPTTIALTKHIGKYIDELTKVLTLDIVQVTSKNITSVKAAGVTRTPTLLHNKKLYTDIEKIVRMLTPSKQAKEQYGLAGGCPEDLTYRYMCSIIDAGEEEDEDPRIARDEDIRRKMSAFQKKRPEMKGVGQDRMLKGGRKVVAKQVKSTFKNDSEFRQTAGLDSEKQTPVGEYMGDEDGSLLLEEYYNQEADLFGRKPNKKPIRWSG